jgi:hypothetical protein
MAVYVDNAQLPYRGMSMSHMVADSTDELLVMADTIGVQRKWIQRAGTNYEHFDVCQSKRALALRHGAKHITNRELGLRLTGRDLL